jgi:hypothetical protein
MRYTNTKRGHLLHNVKKVFRVKTPLVPTVIATVIVIKLLEQRFPVSTKILVISI